MKTISRLIKTMLFATIFVTSSSCSDDDTSTTVQAPTVNMNITTVASGAPQFSTLVTALSITNLVETLNQTGPFTVFAPTNDAFNDFLKTTPYKTLDEVPKEVLREILLNHVVSGINLSQNLSTGYVKSLAKGSASDSNTLSLFINTSDGVLINGISKVTNPDIIATNGVIHQVDKVIGLATIIDHAIANPDAFSTLVTVITSTNSNNNGFGDQSAVATALSTNTSPLTVFAPTNAAFTAATTGDGFAAKATPEQVTKVLQYHVTNVGNVLSNTLKDNQMVPMITDPSQDIVIDLSTPSNPRINDKSSMKAKIIVVDVQCANGIIHAIDKVLQPNL